MQMHTQFQVILKPAPENSQELYLRSLEAIGVDRQKHDIRFVEDNWASPRWAHGPGLEVWLDGLEITQYTYFQQAGGITLDPVPIEYTYGLERIVMFLQNVKEVWQIDWDGKRTYGDVLKMPEIEHCRYDFEVADVGRLKQMYDLFEAEARSCLAHRLRDPRARLRAALLAHLQPAGRARCDRRHRARCLLRAHARPGAAGVRGLRRAAAA